MKRCLTCGADRPQRPREGSSNYERIKYCSPECYWEALKNRPRPSLADRFWSKVDRGPVDACWLWSAGTDRHGYGHISGDRRGQLLLAHRVSYELVVGPIPKGLQLDHLCRNRLCVNPAHLEPVTARENTLRGQSSGAVARRTNKCKRGHEFTPENTRILTGKYGPGRACRACGRMRDQRRDRRAAS